MYVCMYVYIYVYVWIIFYFVLVYLCHCNRFINKLYINDLLFLGYRSLCTFKIARSIVVNSCFCYIFLLYIYIEREYMFIIHVNNNKIIIIIINIWPQTRVTLPFG